MAFFPEMKTALRTYHPVPSLQKTDGNAQDAPRIKNCLKAALLPTEFKSLPPSSPDEVLERRVSTLIEPHAKARLTPTNQRAGHRPPTSIVNLVFVLSNHAAVSILCFPIQILNSLSSLFLLFILMECSTFSICSCRSLWHPQIVDERSYG